MDIDAGITQPAPYPALLTLRKAASARQMGQPSRKIDFARLNQGDCHPDAGGQMSQMSPVIRLTQPTLQGIVKRGVFLTAFVEFEWYLILECWLPLYFPSHAQSPNWKTFQALSHPLLSVNQVAKSTISAIAFFLAGDMFLLWKKYSDLKMQANETFKVCALLRDEPQLSASQAMQIAEDYHLALIQSPPIPFKLYIKFRDLLNDAYRKSYK
jgi:hypothetical protein